MAGSTVIFLSILTVAFLVLTLLPKSKYPDDHDPSKDEEYTT